MNGKGETVTRRRDLGLGSYPEVSLSEARDKAREMRKQIKNGIDPLEQKNRIKEESRIQQRNAKTFRECAEAVIKNKEREFKTVRCHSTWQSSIETYVLPLLGDRIVRTITRADVAAVLEPIWQAKHITAKKIRGRIEAILDYAKAMDYRDGENPAVWKGVLEPILGRVKTKTKPRAALPYVEIGEFMRELRKQESVHARALEFIILAARDGEVFGAVWEEIDLTAKIWTIPAERMKLKKEHRVPLSEEAIKLLESLPRISGSKCVFPAPRGGRIRHELIRRLIRSLHKANIKAGGKGYIDPKQNCVISTHGFRSTFRDWAGETTSYSWEVCEHALAHKLADSTEAAYQRGEYLAKRAMLMADWAKYCGMIHPSADNTIDNAVSAGK